jgi:outer membrane protein TolC
MIKNTSARFLFPKESCMLHVARCTSHVTGFRLQLSGRKSKVEGRRSKIEGRRSKILGLWLRRAVLFAGFLCVQIAAPLVPAQDAVSLIETQREEMAADMLRLSPRIGIQGELTISLPEVIRMALANNKDLEISRMDLQVARFALNSAKGSYDPVFSLQAPYVNSVTPIGSVLGGAADGKLKQREFSFTPQLNGMLPWMGTSYGISFSSSRSVTNTSFATLNPQYPSSLTFSITQPLLRGLRFDSNRQRIEVARKNLSISDEQFRQRVTEIVTQAAKAYWDLVFALQNLDVQISAARVAKSQVESNRRMVEQGLMAPIDIVEAETQLAQFGQNVYNAQASLSVAENSLKTMILPDRTSPFWSRALIPISEPDAPPAEELLEDAINEALANRPELEQAELASEVSQTNLRYYREQTKPQIDLVASYTSSGLAGIVRESSSNPFTGGFPLIVDRLNELSSIQGLVPIDDTLFSSMSGSGVPEVLIGGYSNSLSNLYGFDFPTVQVSLQISLPLLNRTAKGNVASGLVEVRRAEVRHEQLEQQIQAEVRSAIQSLASYKNGLEAARIAHRSAQEQYESEQRKLKAGTSTVFLVLQRQTTLVTAQSSELRARVELAKAVADLERATGRTLKAYNIELDPGT